MPYPGDIYAYIIQRSREGEKERKKKEEIKERKKENRKKKKGLFLAGNLMLFYFCFNTK